MESCSAGTTERPHAGSGGAVLQPLTCARLSPCCTAPLGSTSASSEQESLQNKSVWGWAGLDDVPCDVKGKLTTGFKDSSLRSLLQLSVIQEFAS